MSPSTTSWIDAWNDAEAAASFASASPRAPLASARVATAVAPPPAPAADVELVLVEIARLRADLARRDAITIVVVGVLLTAILQHISRMHEEFHLMASRVGILR